MKYAVIQFLFICLSLIGFGQDSSKIAPRSSIADTSKNLSRDSVFSKAEVKPDFDGGRKGWMDFLAKKLNPNAPSKITLQKEPIL